MIQHDLPLIFCGVYIHYQYFVHPLHITTFKLGTCAGKRR